ncbi:MAG: Ig-like domain-containing protein, partial [Planctomycetaceae bacterium]|nr:Ig-like domain-containing protein [Planctomycetaceae bacterium]
MAAAGAEVEHDLDFDAGTEIQVLVKPAPGSGLQPLMASLEGPGDATLADGLRKTTAKKDQVKKLVLDELGTWTLAVTGAAATTGAYTGTVKVGKAVALDFTEDPPDAPDPDPAPTVSSASPSSVEKPAAGTEERSLTVTGAHFEDGATVAITAPSGTNGISNVQAAFGSSTSLSVTFDLSSAASVGPRTVTVTNPDLRAGTKVSAFTVAAAPGFEVTAVTPSAGPATGGTRILVQGALFEPQATVTIGGKPAEAVLFVDQRNILCTVPPAASPSASEGTPVDVVVSNGGGDATLADGFTYEADVDRPSIASVVPAAGATGVATNLQKMVFVLDEPVLSANVIASNFHFFRSAASGVNDISSPSVVAQGLGPRNRFLVIQRGAATGGTLSTNSIYVGQVQNNNQTTNLITDPAGNALETPQFGTTFYQSSWTTGTTQDTTKPTVLSTGPAASATGVDVDRAPTIVFSEPVDPTTLAAAVTLKQGGTTVACDMDLDAACTTVVLTPRTKLAASTTYTIGVSTGLRDLALNALNTAFAASFTTAAADGTAPAQLVTVDDLPQEMNGSGTYAAGTSNGGTPSGSGAATAFDVYLPLSGFTVDVSFTDAGGSGVDPSSFTCTCSVAMGSVAAGQPLGPLFTVTPMGATWTVPSTHKLASGTNVVFTVGVSDYAGNASTASTLTVDAADIAKTIANANGNAGNDRDPFNSRQSWLLRFDQDIWTVSSASGGSGSHGKPIAVTTSLAGNGVADFREDLTLIGLNGTESARLPQPAVGHRLRRDPGRRLRGHRVPARGGDEGGGRHGHADGLDLGVGVLDDDLHGGRAGQRERRDHRAGHARLPQHGAGERLQHRERLRPEPRHLRDPHDPGAAQRPGGDGLPEDLRSAHRHGLPGRRPRGIEQRRRHRARGDLRLRRGERRPQGPLRSHHDGHRSLRALPVLDRGPRDRPLDGAGARRGAARGALRERPSELPLHRHRELHHHRPHRHPGAQPDGGCLLLRRRHRHGERLLGLRPPEHRLPAAEDD